MRNIILAVLLSSVAVAMSGIVLTGCTFILNNGTLNSKKLRKTKLGGVTMSLQEAKEYQKVHGGIITADGKNTFRVTELKS